MWRAFLLLIVISPSAHSAEAALRLYGTNTLVDFTAAQQAGPGSVYSNYWIAGKVKGRIGQSVLVDQPTGRVRYYYAPSSGDLQGGPGDTLRLTAAIHFTGTNGCSPGQFMAMSPQLKSYFSPRPETEAVLVLRAPDTWPQDQPIRSVGLRSGVLSLPPGRTVISHDNVLSEPATTVHSFDLGSEFKGQISTNYTVFVATPRGLKKKK